MLIKNSSAAPVSQKKPQTPPPKLKFSMEALQTWRCWDGAGLLALSLYLAATQHGIKKPLGGLDKRSGEHSPLQNKQLEKN